MSEEHECDPVTVAVQVDTVRQACKALWELIEDAQAQLDQDYPKDLRAQYPSYERKWKNGAEQIEGYILVHTWLANRLGQAGDVPYGGAKSE